jgi:hypothetical protein
MPLPRAARVNRRWRFLMLRSLVLALKGHNKSAQGIALGACEAGTSRQVIMEVMTVDEIQQQQSEGDKPKGDKPDGKPRFPLLERGARERWGLRRQLRQTLIERMSQGLTDIQAGPAQASVAARMILAASKINLSNITATIRAETHTDLERRMTELEQQQAAYESKNSWTPNPWAK